MTEIYKTKTINADIYCENELYMGRIQKIQSGEKYLAKSDSSEIQAMKNMLAVVEELIGSKYGGVRAEVDSSSDDGFNFIAYWIRDINRYADIPVEFKIFDRKPEYIGSFQSEEQAWRELLKHALKAYDCLLTLNQKKNKSK